VNGKERKLSGEDVFSSLANYLRQKEGATGTKVVCDEGDCGACTVLIGRPRNGQISYLPVNSCIQYLHQLDCAHVITVEGLTLNGKLNPAQTAMVECQGAQCGYCTPGFVVAMTALACSGREITSESVKDALTGNLCRCTGYESIIKAGMEMDCKAMPDLDKLYPPQQMLKAFSELENDPARLSFEDRLCWLPCDLKTAAAIKDGHKGAVIVSGGTDVCVQCNKRDWEPGVLISLCKVAGLSLIEQKDGIISVGARATLSQLEEFIKGSIPEMTRIMWLFGSPQIRYAGTLAGNIANGSPIADTLPFLFVMEAEVELAGSRGSRRVNINRLYKGYKMLDIAQDELISRILIPAPDPSDLLKLYKVSKRQNLDISTFTAAIRLKLDGRKIASAKLAYGGVAPVVLRLPQTEAFLADKQMELDTFERAADVALAEIAPISDVRGSSEYRNLLAKNILSRFYYEVTDERAIACP